MIARIPYTQTWEDTQVLRRALAIRPDDRVLTITAAGGAPVAVLQDEPAALVSIDAQASQTRLVRLVSVAAEALPYDAFLAFLGIREAQDRLAVYRRLTSELEREDVRFWEGRMGDIAQGIIHAGRLEHYFRLFSRHVLRHLVDSRTVHQLLRASSLAVQSAVYHRSWDTWRWRLGLKLFYGRRLFQRYGRDRSYFEYAQANPGTVYAQRAVRGLTEIPARTNWILEYLLTGQYRQATPPMYREEGWRSWQQVRRRARLHTGDIRSQISSLGTFTKVHLSDIFEGFSSHECIEFFTRLAPQVVPGGRVCFWTNLAMPPIADLAACGFRHLSGESAALWRSDNGFIYGGFVLLEKEPQP